jgi:hypothetical protein
MASFSPSATIRTTSESNFTGRIRALVFGEDPRVINPGDMILEMEKVGKPGDRLGNNLERFEIYIAGREMAGLLEQVTRAASLFTQNAEWLLSPSSRPATAQEIADHAPIVRADKVKPVVNAERLTAHLEALKTFVPTLKRS